MGLVRSKGSIIVGYDADLTCVDLGKAWRLERSDVVSSASYSIYEGWLFQGAIVHAMSRGQFVLRDGPLQDSTVGLGRFDSRQQCPSGHGI